MFDSTVHELCAAADCLFNEFACGSTEDNLYEIKYFSQICQMIPKRYYASAYFGTFSQNDGIPICSLAEKVLMIQVIGICLKAGIVLQEIKTTDSNKEKLYNNFRELTETIERTFQMIHVIIPSQTKWVQDRIQEFKAELINK